MPCALREARLKVSPAFSKAVESRGKASGRPPQRAELSFALISAGGGLRGNPRRGFPLIFFTLYVCAVTLGGGRCPVLPFDPISLVLAQRNGVEPPKKSAFLPRWLHHPRERYCFVYYTFLARLGEGAGGGLGLSTCAPIRWEVFVAPSCLSTPFLWCLPKETVSSRQRKAL